MERYRILVVDDEEKMRRILQLVLRQEGYAIDLAEDGRRAQDLLKAGRFDAVITDLKMPEGDGMTLLRAVGELDPDLPVVVLTAYGTIPSAVQAMKEGAVDYLLKPIDNEALKLVVTKAIAAGRLRRENRYLRQEVERRYPLADFVGVSSTMREALRLSQQVAKTSSTVLLMGESGTGKELLARAIHAWSPRATASFIAVSCSALTDTLLESELFGHEKGAFTGAHRTRPGRFELADGGTLFLDEVGEMSPAVQVKLLRVLQERSFERVGGTHQLQVDVRVIAATNRDLARAMEEGRFRRDLFYRLNVFPITLPPLRERPEDIPLLAQHFLSRFSSEMGKPIEGISEAAISYLQHHPWPGNVRELENVMERAVILARGPKITPRDLVIPGQAAEPLDVSIPLQGLSLEVLERRLIERALEMAKGNQSQAARLLGLTRHALRYRMEKHGLPHEP
jgi:DNA-binding NtrC family response regulator